MTSAAKARSLTVLGFDGVRVKPENTAIDKNRNWALNKADQMIKEDDRAVDKFVEKKQGNDKGIYVDGMAAFVQRERYSIGGEFICSLSNFRLPWGHGEVAQQHFSKSSCVFTSSIPC